MIVALSIVQYFLLAVTDVLDKFLISQRKILPASYTFWTVVTGVLVIVVWPFTYFALPLRLILLNLISGAFFSLTLYVFFKALSQGEVSRVVPFVFGLVPVFDLLIASLTGRNVLHLNEVAAIILLIPGAFLISYRRGFLGRHLGLKVLSAFLFSSYYALWQYGAQVGPVLNNFIWNRIGAAAILLLVLLIPVARKNIFLHQQVTKKKNTAVLFLLKQALGGASFIFLSWLMVVGKISVINALLGFRYVFLFFIALFLSSKFRRVLEEDISRQTLWQKVGAIGLIFAGTFLLFIKL